MQVYYDFSGYSDMAIGLGKMFGFNFDENFNFPYQSRSMQEYWRRWHISLSTWFRDYLYFPLGGNRISEARTYMNLTTVFLLTGLWHGASWNFVIWGMYHGSFLLLERSAFSKILSSSSFLGHIYVLFVSFVGIILFRFEDLDQLGAYFSAAFSFRIENSLSIFTAQQLLYISIGVLGSFRWISAEKVQFMESNRSLKSLFRVFLVVVFLLCILEVATNTYNPFIYFRF